MRGNVMEIRLRDRYRKYEYIVRYSGATGRLLCITAGCRRWVSFAVAKAHYRGEGPYANKWLTSNIISNGNWVSIVVNRAEAQWVINELERRYNRAFTKIKHRRAVARKRKV